MLSLRFPRLANNSLSAARLTAIVPTLCADYIYL